MIEQLAEGVTLYLGNCREILPTLGEVDAIVTDPPYGIAYNPKYPSKARMNVKYAGGKFISGPKSLLAMINRLIQIVC